MEAKSNLFYDELGWFQKECIEEDFGDTILNRDGSCFFDLRWQFPSCGENYDVEDALKFQLQSMCDSVCDLAIGEQHPTKQSGLLIKLSEQQTIPNLSVTLSIYDKQ